MNRPFAKRGPVFFFSAGCQPNPASFKVLVGILNLGSSVEVGTARHRPFRVISGLILLKEAYSAMINKSRKAVPLFMVSEFREGKWHDIEATSDEAWARGARETGQGPDRGARAPAAKSSLGWC